MAAAYASLVSLLNTLDQIQIHPLLSTCFSSHLNESIREKVDLFLDFVEKYSDTESKEAKDLVRRIAAAAHEAEDDIEVQAANCIGSGSNGTSQLTNDELKKIIQEMECIKTQVININSAAQVSDEQSRRLVPDLLEDKAAKKLETGSVNQKPNMMGFDRYLEQLLDPLTGQPSALQILPIIGMGGIGKTTLARSAYENPLTVEHFYVRGWVTVSQDFSKIDILLQALSCLGKKDITVGELDLSVTKQKLPAFVKPENRSVSLEMAAAYASLVSLLNTLDQIQIHPLISTCFSLHLNESIRQKVHLFLDFVEKYSDTESKEAEDLVTRIAAAAHEAEDAIEVQAANCIGSGSNGTSQLTHDELKKIIQEMECIKTQVININSAAQVSDEQSRRPVLDLQEDKATKKLETGSVNQKPNMVGFDRYLKQLLDRLTWQPSALQILPIVGMGGIGKTTLARSAYENPLVVEHFYVRGWVTVSQDFSKIDILRQALSCLGSSSSNTSVAELGEKLHKTLYGRRYLIVLDDVWSVEAWDKIKPFFPNNHNGSRILLTTRQSELAGYFSSSALKVDFLDDKSSWDIFCKVTFGQEYFPPHLVEIGKCIVHKCQGLPLAIVVVGGFLLNSPATLEYWEKIAKDKCLILGSREGKESLSILNLSYKHLPIWLKACFLYMGLFPEDHRMNVSQLIQLWVAEGLIKPNAHQSLEETAEDYLKELTDRNLVLVGGLRRNKKMKTCYIHDLVRDMCIRIAEEEDYFCVQRSMDGKRHFVVDRRNAMFYPQDYPTSKKPSIFSPLLIDGERAMQSKSRMMRVLWMDTEDDIETGEVNLRFLHGGYASNLSSSISQLWSLQTLMICNYIPITAPNEIWEMPQLRHINMWSVYLPDPIPSDDGLLSENLQMLHYVTNLTFSEEFCKRMPNIKDLKINYNPREEGGEHSCYQMQNIGLLKKLELLYCTQVWRYFQFKNLTLPSSLKELTLDGCKLVESDMRMIGSLPHLQILILRGNQLVGEEWNVFEGEFRCLNYLEICACNELIKWNIVETSYCFPVLETLRLASLSKLEKRSLHALGRYLHSKAYK